LKRAYIRLEADFLSNAKVDLWRFSQPCIFEGRYENEDEIKNEYDGV